MMLRLVFVALSLGFAASFAPRATTNTRSSFFLKMAPKFDGEKWLPQSKDDMPSAGYGVGRTFLLQGPKPVFTRLFQPDDYEQAVLKFMASDKCDRRTAQGNMDAYLRNPQDWMFNRMEEEKRGMKYNYVDIDFKNIVLVLTWSAIVSLVVGRAAYSLANGVDFVSCCWNRDVGRLWVACTWTEILTNTHFYRRSTRLVPLLDQPKWGLITIVAKRFQPALELVVLGALLQSIRCAYSEKFLNVSKVISLVLKAPLLW